MKRVKLVSRCNATILMPEEICPEEVTLEIDKPSTIK